jgi:DnaK suppressor protein
MPLNARDHLSSVQLQAIREQLLGQLLWRSLELDRLMTTLNSHTTPATARHTLYAQITRAEAHTAALQHALERLRTGEYGRCRTCDEPIPFSHLKLQPLTRHCPQHTTRQRGTTADDATDDKPDSPGGFPDDRVR